MMKAKMKDKVKFFIYGALKRGGKYHYLLKDAKYIGKYTTKEKIPNDRFRIWFSIFIK